MTIIETSIKIGKPVQKVFEFISNFENQKKLNNMLTDVIVSGPIKVGTKIKYKGSAMGRPFETENEIIAYEPNKLISIKTKAAPPASDVTNAYIFESDGGGAKVTATMDCVVMPGTEGMVVPSLKGMLDTTLAGIKKAVEG